MPESADTQPAASEAAHARVLPASVADAGAAAPPAKSAVPAAAKAPMNTDAGIQPDAAMPVAQSAGRTAAVSVEPEDDAGSPVLDLGHGEGGAQRAEGKLTAYIQMRDIPTGAEAHRCVVVELANPEPVWVGALHGTLSDGSHHLIVDRRTSQDALQDRAIDCSPTMAGDATRLLIAQQRETKLDLPEGVGYRLEAHQRIFLQLHYINATSRPLDIRGEVQLDLLDAAAMPLEAKSVFTGATSISLPPHETGSAVHFQSFASDPAWQVFALTSHTHRLGVQTTIERVASLDAPATKPLHESLDWAEPPLTVFESPLTFTGDDGLRLTCSYNNTTDRHVSFGVGVDAEMCFMWLYYFEKRAP